jgi:hypothetical protein
MPGPDPNRNRTWEVPMVLLVLLVPAVMAAFLLAMERLEAALLGTTSSPGLGAALPARTGPSTPPLPAIR